jgi:LacI family transcriptional regulator
MRISNASAERVRRAARELDYRPNLAARLLKSQISRTVALLSDEVATDGYAGKIIAGSLARAVEAEHMLYVGEFGGDHRLENQLIVDFVSRQVDGFILASTFTRRINLSGQLNGHQVVLANCLSKPKMRSAVIPDDMAGGRTAAEYLLSRGHGERVFLVGETPGDLIGASERHQGIEDTFRLEGLELAGQIDCKWWPESAFEAVSAFLAQGQRPSTFICMNDRVALGVYQALTARGVVIPDDVSVISFDDSTLASWLQPALTSVAIPHFEIGQKAVDLLLAMPATIEIVRLPMPLRERGSVRAAA